MTDLQDTLDGINKRYGEGAIFRGSDHALENVDVIPTGAMTLDQALGVGGIPRGRITEIFSWESMGKSTLCQHIVGEAQKLGITAAYVDQEHTLEPAYAEICGVDYEKLLVSQPDNAEQAMEVVEALVRSKSVGLVVVDSVAALATSSELEGDMGDAHMAQTARLMSQALRKINPALKKSNCSLIFTNQKRHKIGVMFGNPETTFGGNALKFYASVRINLHARRTEKGDAIQVTARVVKNKLAPPYKEAEFDIPYGQGIDTVGCILEASDKIERRGAYYYYDGEQLGQGKANAADFLREHPDIVEALRG